MESQCKTHCLTPLSGSVADRLPFCAAPYRRSGMFRISYFDTPRKLFMQKVPDAFCILLYGTPVKFLIRFGYPTVYVKVVVCDKDPVTVAIMTVQVITRADPHYVITIDARRGF